jgi:hypothetical protein
MDYLFQDGGKPKKAKTTKSKTGTKTTKTTKSKTGTKTTKTTKTKKSKTTSGSRKGGNFLGSVGELVAPTGWENFVTTAALVGIDRADAALRRGKESKKSVKKMSGGGSFGNLLTTGKEKFLETFPAVRRVFPNKKKETNGNNSNFWKKSDNGDNSNYLKQFKNEIDELEKEASSFKIISLIDKGCPKTKKTIIDELITDYHNDRYYNKGKNISPNQYRKNMESKDFRNGLVVRYISRLDKLISKKNELLKTANIIQNTKSKGFLNDFTNKRMKLERKIEELEKHKKDFIEKRISNQNSNSERKNQERIIQECLGQRQQD